jgi:DedD protein
MDSALKTRLIGATVLIGLIVIFMPMFLDSDTDAPIATQVDEVSLEIPPPEIGGMQTRTISVDPEAPVPETLIGDGDEIAQVDTRKAAPTVTRLPSEQSGAINRDEPAPAPTVSAPVVSAPIVVPTPAPRVTAQPAAANTPPVAATPKPQTPPKPVVATAAAPTMAPLPSAKSGRFGVNFGSYSSQANAEKLVAQLKAAKIDAKVEPVQVDSRDLYRVAVRGYESRTAAEQVKASAVRVVANLSANVITGELASPTAPASRPVDPALAKFAVQIGVYSDSAKAQALVDQIKAKGFPGFIERIVTPAGTSLRVRVGPTLKRADAESIRANLRAKAGVEGIVVEH